MRFIRDSGLDLERLRKEYRLHKAAAFFANRGYHSLLIYRLANTLYKAGIPALPFFMTRLVQILYSIDIDYRADISGGIVIIHGVGIVIGQGAVIRTGATIYHGVTLGRKKQGFVIPSDDGFPTIESNCTLGAGAKILGPVLIGTNCIIGPNCVVTEDVPEDHTVKLGSLAFSSRSRTQRSVYNDLNVY